MSKTKSKRDAGVETARLIACLIVLGCHTMMSVIYNDQYQPGRVFLSCLFADGVGIFWMITGCFLFSKTYGKTLLHGLTRILIPLILISVAGYLVSCLPLPGFARPGVDYMIDSVVHWRNAIPGMEHLWYLYINLLVIVFFPLLKALVRLIDRQPIYQGIFLVVAFVAFAINDVFSNHLFHFSHDLFFAAIPAAILMIWGHILYQHRQAFRSKWMSLVLLLLFLGFNALRMALQMQRYCVDPANNSLIYWFSSMGVLAETCLLTACMAWFRPDDVRPSKTSQSAQTLLTTLASYSFLIYLVHFPIVRILNALGIPGRIYDLLLGQSTSFGKELLYSVIMIALLFVLSLFVSWLIRLFWKGVRRLFRSHKTTKKEISSH